MDMLQYCTNLQYFSQPNTPEISFYYRTPQRFATIPPIPLIATW
jgi:hypothetical protein